MKKTRRLSFIFDEHIFAITKDLTEAGHYASMADMMREVLIISHAIRYQVQQGFTELVVRNPDTKEERVIVTRLLT